MAIVDFDPTQYTHLPFETYGTLTDTIQALVEGEILFIKKFERQEGASVLVRLVQKKFAVTLISYDIGYNELDPRYWSTFKIGINDLSLFSCFKFNEDLFKHTNKFMVNDVVHYTSEDGIMDSALIEEVYMSNTDPDKFVYQLSRDAGIYAQDELIQHKYL